MTDNGYTWSVTGQQNDSQIDTAGNVIAGKTVTFQITPSGQTGTVFIPNTSYSNTNSVREMIQAEVDQLETVRNLTG